MATRKIPPQKKGQKPITFKEGGLHKSLGVPQGKKIPASKMQAALGGAYGAKAKKQAQFAKNVLTGPKPKARMAQGGVAMPGNAAAQKKAKDAHMTQYGPRDRAMFPRKTAPRTGPVETPQRLVGFPRKTEPIATELPFFQGERPTGPVSPPPGFVPPPDWERRIKAGPGVQPPPPIPAQPRNWTAVDAMKMLQAAQKTADPRAAQFLKGAADYILKQVAGINPVYQLSSPAKDPGLYAQKMGRGGTVRKGRATKRGRAK